MDITHDMNRYSFIIGSHGPVSEIGILDSSFFFTMNSDGSNKRLHMLDNEEPRKDISKDYPEKAESMEKLGWGLYETSRYISYDNAPERFK